ncbi:hypothetical protein MSAN_00938600 [Mycena sanguinolenta]|uniref:Uncharacterized protein n=1 Tax=Mycena sanguinolenta TaxID=230812 RepID=A0A8H6YUV9_9AGAR|nr:hypothetical protein MSAN_00938600 [Mycena sanguinolenta]
MSSAISLIALAVLENPRVIPKTKTVVFDGQIYLGSSEPAIIVSLRYYNATDMAFPDVGRYSVVVHPARTSPTVEVYSQELTPVDYHAFGDIVSIIPLGSPENFELQHHAVVHVCGVPSNVNKKNSTFEIHAEQYLSATKSTDNVFPVQCLFPATPRWEKYKPIPAKGKSVAIEGLLTGVERNDDRTVNRFIVDLEKVTFLGTAASGVPKAEESPTKMINNGTPARLKFTGFFANHSDTKEGEPSTKKRKTADDRALEESQEIDKGEGTSTGRRASRH